EAPPVLLSRFGPDPQLEARRHRLSPLARRFARQNQLPGLRRGVVPDASPAELGGAVTRDRRGCGVSVADGARLADEDGGRSVLGQSAKRGLTRPQLLLGTLAFDVLAAQRLVVQPHVIQCDLERVGARALRG